MQWRLRVWDPGHTKRHHGGVDCPGHVTAVVVANGAKGQQFHSKKNHYCCSWVAAVAGCYWAAAIENLYSAAGSDSPIRICTQPAT